MDPVLFSFALIADVQYADLDDGYNYLQTKRRYYRNSINLLTQAIQQWNNQSTKPSFLFQLGDLIDGKNSRHQGMSQSSWDKVMRELSVFNGKVYHTFGNHEYYNFTHRQIAQLLPSMTLAVNESQGLEREESATTRLRYTFSPHMDFLFVVLDSYEVSMLGYDLKDPEYIEGKEILLAKNQNKDLNSPEGLVGQDQRFLLYNGAVGSQQLKWLDEKLTQAEAAGQKVVIMTHIQLVYTGSEVIWDTHEVMAVLHRHSCVVAVFAGHDHDGGYHLDDHGIHHVIMPGVVETDPNDQAHATVHVHRNKLVLEAFGSRVSSKVLAFT